MKPDLLFPAEAEAVVTVEHFEVSMHATFSEARQSYCIDEVRVRSTNAEPITSQALRGIALQEHFTSALELDIRTASGEEYTPRSANDFGPEESTAFFIEAARIYVVARATLGNPLKAVADHYGVSQSTATRWASQARTFGRIE